MLIDRSDPIELSRRRPAPEALALLSAEDARRLGILPLLVVNGTAQVVAARPAEDEVRALLSTLPVERVETPPARTTSSRH